MPQNGFLYSIGGENAGECDNSPVTHKAFSCEEVMRAIEKTARSCKKSGLYFSFAYSSEVGTRGRRKAENAQPLPLLILDVDKATPEQYAALPERMKRWTAFTYPSFTHLSPKYVTAKNPRAGQTVKTIRDDLGRIFENVVLGADGQPQIKEPPLARFRVVIALSRAPSAEERELLMRWAGERLGVDVDLSTTDGARLYYTPRINCKDEDIKSYSGAPVDVDAALKEERESLAPASPFGSAPQPIAPVHAGSGAGRVSSSSSSTPSAEAAADAPVPSPEPAASNGSEEELWDIRPSQNPEDDMALQRLRERGMVLGPSSRQEGAWDIVCPFEHEHSTEGGNGDTYYYPAGSRANRDKKNQPFRLGRFHCLHSCRARHTQADYFAAIGLNYEAYCRAANGESTTLFKGEGGRLYRRDQYGRVWMRATDKHGELMPPQLLCSNFEVLGLVRDAEGCNQKIRVRFRDSESRWHVYDIARGDLLARDPASVLRPIYNEGFLLKGRGKAANVLDYLEGFPIELLPVFMGVPALGWVELEGRYVFVKASETIYPCKPAEWHRAQVVYTGGKERGAKLAKRGALKEWQDNLGSYCRYSSRLTLAVCAALAAPCLSIVGLEGGAFNIYGRSSRGKTLCQRIAASVFGRGSSSAGGGADPYIRSWKGSATGFEQDCLGHNDLPLILDEGGMASKKDRGTIVYSLANGIEKSRGTINGQEIDRRKSYTWRTLGLSAAEMPVEEWIREGDPRARVYAGQRARLVDVYALPKNDTYGVFESLPEGVTAKDLTADLEGRAETFYGTVGEQWLEYLVCNREAAKEELKQLAKEFEKPFITPNMDGQAGRVLRRFALAAAAGALATRLGLTGWEGNAFIFRQIRACAIDALRPFKAGAENSDLLRELISTCTQKAAQFEPAPYIVRAVHPSPCLGSRWDANADGTFYYGPQQETNWDVATGGAAAPVRPADQAPETAYFFFKDVFQRICHGREAARGAAQWLLREGAMIELNRDKKAAPGLSRCGKSYGLSNKKTDGYIVLLGKLQELDARLAADD